MSMSFGGPGGAGRLNFGSGASGTALDDLDTCTVMWWAKVNDSTPSTAGTIFDKGDATHRWRARNLVGGSIQYVRDRATTDLTIDALISNIANYPGDGAWAFFAIVADAAGANGSQHIYGGSLLLPPVEASAYVTQVVGSGATQTNAADACLFGNDAGFANAYDAVLGPVGVFAAALTLAQIRSFWRRPRKMLSTCRLLCRMTGTTLATGIQDYSGNLNNGGSTSVTAAAPWPRWWSWGPGLIRRSVVSASGNDMLFAMQRRRRRLSNLMQR